MKSVVWFVFAFVLGFAFLLLLFAFRSLVIAAKAIVLNLLSVAAAYGILVLVFQHGWGKQLLGFDATGGIVPFLPIFLFVILFGLSMDYHVFILSRIREAYDRGATTDEGGRARDQDDRGCHHERRARHGLRLLGLRRALVHDLQADRRRARCRDPDRRDNRPRGPPPCIDEAPRRVELVPAELAGVVASSRPRRVDERRRAPARHSRDRPGVVARCRRPSQTTSTAPSAGVSVSHL